MIPLRLSFQYVQYEMKTLTYTHTMYRVVLGGVNFISTMKWIIEAKWNEQSYAC